MSPRSWLKVFQRLALASAVFVVGLAVCEIGFRGWLRMHGQPYDPARVEEALRAAVDPSASLARGIVGQKLPDERRKEFGILHPYAGSERQHDTEGVLAHFHQGPPPEEYSVVVLGGSVATLFGNAAGPELEQLLSRDPFFARRRVRVLNYAHVSFKQPQQLMRLAYLLSLGYRPDAVINIDGFNEVALAYENGTFGTNPVYPSFPVWGVLVQDFGALDPEQLDSTLELWQLRKSMSELVDGALKWHLADSAIAGRFVQSRVRNCANRRFEVQTVLNGRSANAAQRPDVRRQLNGPDYSRNPGRMLQLCLQDWFESSISIQALCESRGIVYLHVLQPTLHDRGSKPLTPTEQAMPPGPVAWRPAVIAGYPRLRQQSKELEKRGVHFLDASQVFAHTPETLYFDACHFVPAGSILLARAIAPYFLEHVLQRNAGSGGTTGVTRAAAVALVAPTGDVGPSASQSSSAEQRAQCLVCKSQGDLARVDVTVRADTPRTVYLGTTYYFCREQCRTDFEKDPSRYLHP